MIFPTGQTDYLSELKAMQSSPTERTWALFMTAGGHFAGAIVRVAIADDERTASRAQTGKKSQKGPKPEIEVLRHKTFHRYTSAYIISQMILTSTLRSASKAGWFARIE